MMGQLEKRNKIIPHYKIIGTVLFKIKYRPWMSLEDDD